MRNNKWILFACFLFLSGCVTTDYVKLKIEIPRNVEVDLMKYKSIFITPFLVKEEMTEIDLSQEIAEYLIGELKRKAANPILAADTAPDNEEQLKSPEYWKSLDSNSQGNLYISGSARYIEETRKALIKQGRKRFEDPFPNPSKLEQRKFYNLDLDLYIIDATSGEPIYKREFKESKSYTNPNQTIYNSFFDLILLVKEKLFRAILGTEQLGERYLIIKDKE